MMWISRSTTSQRCSIGLRSGDCGGHLSKVNSLSCSRNQSEMIWALWHGALSCWKYIRRWYTVVIKGWTWSATIIRLHVVYLNHAQLILRGSKCVKKISPTHYTPPPTWTVETRQDGSMLSCSFRQILTLPSECRSRNQDSSDQATFFQSSIVQFWWSCVNCSLRFLFLSDRSGIRCGLLLLEPICFRVRCVVCSEMIFFIPWL